MELSYTDVHYIDYPTNTFNALRRCTLLFFLMLYVSVNIFSHVRFSCIPGLKQYQAEDNWGLVQGNKTVLRGESD